MVKKGKKKKNREIFCEGLGWKTIFHYIGYLGMLTLLYWIIQYVAYYGQKENKFFSMTFYRINYVFGIIIAISMTFFFLIDI